MPSRLLKYWWASQSLERWRQKKAWVFIFIYFFIQNNSVMHQMFTTNKARNNKTKGRKRHNISKHWISVRYNKTYWKDTVNPQVTFIFLKIKMYQKKKDEKERFTLTNLGNFAKKIPTYALSLLWHIKLKIPLSLTTLCLGKIHRMIIADMLGI